MIALSAALWMTTALSATPAPAASVDAYVTPRAFKAGAARWRVIDLRTGGVSRIDRLQPDANDDPGALEQVLPAPGLPEYSTEIQLLSRDTVLDPQGGLRPTRGGFGRLSDLRALEMAWYRDGSSTVLPWLAAALRVYVYDPDLGVNGSSWAMVWEPIYNGYAPLPGRAVPTDTWVRSAVQGDVFWRTPLFIDGQRPPSTFCRDNYAQCYNFWNTLADWGFGPRAVIFGLTVAAGSGWSGTYRGFVDDVILAVGDRRWTWDFAGRRPRRNRGRR